MLIWRPFSTKSLVPHDMHVILSNNQKRPRLFIINDPENLVAKKRRGRNTGRKVLWELDICKLVCGCDIDTRTSI